MVAGDRFKFFIPHSAHSLTKFAVVFYTPYPHALVFNDLLVAHINGMVLVDTTAFVYGYMKARFDS